MSTRQKMIIFLVGLLVVGGIIIGISENARAEKKKVVELTIWSHLGGEWGEKFDAIVEEFNKTVGIKKGIHVSHAGQIMEEYYKKIIVAHLSGTSPDIYKQPARWVPDFVEKYMIVEAPADIMEDITTNFIPFSVKNVTHKGKIWGYPGHLATNALIYNKRLFEQAGIDPNSPPKDWNEMVEYANKLVLYDAAGKKIQAGYGFAIGYNEGIVHPFAAMLWANNGELFTKDHSKCLFNSPAGVEALRTLVDMAKASNIGFIDYNPGYHEGKIAMMIFDVWIEKSIRDEGRPWVYENTGTCLIPVSPKTGKTSSFGRGWMYTVSNSCKHPREAWDFLKWLEEESRIGNFEVNVFTCLSGHKMALKNPGLKDAFSKAYVEAFKVARVQPKMKGYEEVFLYELQKTIESALYFQKTPEQALNEAVEKGNKVLAEYHE